MKDIDDLNKMEEMLISKKKKTSELKKRKRKDKAILQTLTNDVQPEPRVDSNLNPV